MTTFYVTKPKVGQSYTYRCATFSESTPDGPILTHDERCGQAVTVVGAQFIFQAQNGAWYRGAPQYTVRFEDGVEIRVYAEWLREP